jgi:hypothetical protein
VGSSPIAPAIFPHQRSSVDARRNSPALSHALLDTHDG